MTLSGLTEVETTLKFLRVQEIQVISACSSEKNIGVISAYINDEEHKILMSQISAGESKSTTTFVSVPKENAAEIVPISFDTALLANEFITYRLYSRKMFEDEYVVTLHCQYQVCAFNAHIPFRLPTKK